MNRKFSLVMIVSVLVTGFVGWSCSTRSSSPSYRVVVRGSTKTNDQIRISGGNLVAVAPDPGLFFGTVRKPGETEQFTYLIVFRCDVSQEIASARVLKSHCASEGRIAETRNSLGLNGKQIEATYELELDETRTSVERERLTIGGEIVDVALGRVFLIDLTAEEPEYFQTSIELPAIESSLETTDDVEQLAERLMTTLKPYAK